MLPTSRIISALILGFGLFLLVAGIVAPRFIHTDARLPLDLEHSTWTVRDDEARTRIVAEDRVVTAPVTQQLHMDLLEPADDSQVSARIGTSMLRESGQEELDRLIEAGIWNIAFDRATGEIIGPAQLSHTPITPASEVDIDGLWVKFPMGAETTTYEVFDPTLRQTAPAEFVDTVEMDGHELYRYRQVIEPTNVAKLYANERNTKVVALDEDEDAEPQAEPATEQLFLYHSARRDFYVDPRTGMIVDMDVEIDDFYGTNDGERREDVLEFSGSISDDDSQDLLEQSEDFPNESTATAIRWAVIIAGAVIAVIGVVGVFFGGSRSSARARSARSKHSASSAGSQK